jgi:hypothetical protein
VRWEPPEPDADLAPEHQVAAVPAFEAAQFQVRSNEGLREDLGEPGADVSWHFEPVPEPPPAAPKAQWWAGWLPDPRGRHEFRFWDGNLWTDHVADNGLAGHDPL